MKVLIMLFHCNGMGILNIDLNNINLDNSFDEDVRDSIILIRDFWLGKLNLKNAKNLKIVK